MAKRVKINFNKLGEIVMNGTLDDVVGALIAAKASHDGVKQYHDEYEDDRTEGRERFLQTVARWVDALEQRKAYLTQRSIERRFMALAKDRLSAETYESMLRCVMEGIQ